MESKVEYKANITLRNRLICKKYWAGVSSNKKNSFTYNCREIGDYFGLTANEVSRIARANAYLVISDYRCIKCSSPMAVNNRTEFMKISLDDQRCSKCLIELYYSIQRDRKNKYEQVIQQKSRIKQFHHGLLIEFRRDQMNSVPDLDDINIVDHYLLVAVITSLGSDNLRSTVPLIHNLDMPLSPLHRLDGKVLDRLMRKNLLLVDMEDSYDYLDSDSEGELQFDMFGMKFDFSHDPEQLKKLIINSNDKVFKQRIINSTEYKEWCQKIQLEECVSYLAHRSTIHGFKSHVSEKMQSLLSTCLLKYSVSEVYYMIWGAVESASLYSKKSGINKAIAANSIYSNIQKTFEKINNNLLSSKHYNRGNTQLQSALSKTFFDQIYEIEDCGFKYTINELLKQFLATKKLII